MHNYNLNSVKNIQSILLKEQAHITNEDTIDAWRKLCHDPFLSKDIRLTFHVISSGWFQHRHIVCLRGRCSRQLRVPEPRVPRCPHCVCASLRLDARGSPVSAF